MEKRRWTPREDRLLLRQVKAFPQNLTKCFMVVAEQTGRTKESVSFRWYNKVSKDPNNVAFFTASPHTVSKNKKVTNEPTENRPSIWYRLLSLIRNL